MEVGTLVKVVDNINNHGFSIGEVVRYVGGPGEDGFEYVDGSDFWFMEPEEYEVIEE